jgi:hypothetical protein
MDFLLKVLAYVGCAILGAVFSAIGYEPTRLLIESLIDKVSGKKRKKVNLTGTWYAAWQTRVEGKEVLNTELIEVKQKGTKITLFNKEKSPENKLGGYFWRGECRIYNNEQIIGYYLPVEDNIASKGSLYFTLNRVGNFMVGKWVGCNYDCVLIWGFGVIAKEREFARQKLEQLVHAKKGISSV